MPFRTINVSEPIELLRKMDPDFKKAWDESRTEYQQIGEMISLRKKEKIRDLKIRRNSRPENGREFLLSPCHVRKMLLCLCHKIVRT